MRVIQISPARSNAQWNEDGKADLVLFLLGIVQVNRLVFPKLAAQDVTELLDYHVNGILVSTAAPKLQHDGLRLTAKRWRSAK